MYHSIRASDPVRLRQSLPRYYIRYLSLPYVQESSCRYIYLADCSIGKPWFAIGVDDANWRGWWTV